MIDTFAHLYHTIIYVLWGFRLFRFSSISFFFFCHAFDKYFIMRRVGYFSCFLYCISINIYIYYCCWISSDQSIIGFYGGQKYITENRNNKSHKKKNLVQIELFSDLLFCKLDLVIFLFLFFFWLFITIYYWFNELCVTKSNKKKEFLLFFFFVYRI